MTQIINQNKSDGSSGTARFSPSLQNAILVAQSKKKAPSFAKIPETSNSLDIAYPPSNL